MRREEPPAITTGTGVLTTRQSALTPKAVRTGYDVPPEVTRASLAPYAQRPGWAGLSAIRAGELHAISRKLIARTQSSGGQLVRTTHEAMGLTTAEAAP